MSLDIPSIQKIDGSGFRIAVIASRYNEALVDSLVHHACATLEASGAVSPLVERVPGAAELPFAAATLAKHGSFDAIICIGVVIAGDTNHHEIIADSTATALLDLSIAKKSPSDKRYSRRQESSPSPSSRWGRNQSWQRICPSRP